MKLSDVTKASICLLIGFRPEIQHAQSETSRVKVVFNLYKYPR